MNLAVQPLASPVEAQIIDPLAGETWDRLLEQHPGASVFHASAWAKLLHRTYGHRPRYLRFHSAGATVALLPLMEVRSTLTGLRGVSLPFSDFCGPLWIDPSRSEEVFHQLQSLCLELGWSRLDLRCESSAPADARPWRIHQGHALDLSKGLAAVEHGLSQQAVRSLRKSAKSGVVVETSDRLDAVRQFYRLHGLTRRRHGLPPQSPDFFEILHQEIIAKGNGHVVLAHSGREVIAASVFLKFRESAIYKFGASDTRFWPLCPNHAVMWEGIRTMIQAGCRSLHFGRTSPNDRGLSRFKRSWGADNSSIRQFRYSSREHGWKGGTDPAAESHRAIFGWLPLRFNRILGSLIYPHLD